MAHSNTPRSIQTIVVGVDYSEPSRHAFEEGVRLAREESCRLVVTHFIYDEEMAHVIRWQGMTEAELIGGCRNRIEKWIEENDAKELSIECKVEVGHPFAELMETVESESADILILGAQGEGHVNHPNTVGVVAQACLRRCPCDLMLVRKEHPHPFRKVVVAIDFSENSKRAVHEAAELARADGASLNVVHVFAPAWKYYGERNETREDIDIYLGEMRKKFADFTYEEWGEIEGLETTFEVRESMNVTHGIVEYAQEESADLIVLGTVGRAPRRITVPGTTAERVVETSSCSVLVVRPTVNFSWI